MRHANYDRIAATYDERYGANDYSGIERALFDFVGAARVRVLEVGCGTGHWLERLHTARSISPTGLDPSESMLGIARSKRPFAPIVQGRAEALPLADATLHRIFSINAHHHFDDKRLAIQEARRVLRPGGSLMMVALDPHNGRDQWWIYDYFEGSLDIDKQRYPACFQIREWMREAGFVDAYTREVQHLPGDVLARDALANGIVTPSHTSQLAVLTRAEFETGVARIRAALAQNPGLRLSADLRVYATYGAAL